MLSRVEYLYGVDVDPSLWATMPYKEVLELKAQLAYDRIGVLYKAHYMETDSLNVNECSRAISFNEKLLKELK